MRHLNPRQVAVLHIPRANKESVQILDATDEEFEAFSIAIGIPVDEQEEGKRWSFDNRCRAINYALKYGLPLGIALPDDEERQVLHG